MTNDENSNTHVTERFSVERIIEFLRNIFDDFAVREDADRKFFTLLALDFENLNIEEELKQYYAWTLDQETIGRRSNHRSRFRQWLSRGAQMKKHNTPQKAGGNHVRD